MKMLGAVLSVGLFVACARPGVAAMTDILNFGQVNDELYRGAQPDLKAMQQLKVLGVKSIIDLRMTNDAWKGEKGAATAGLMVYTNIPFAPLSAPTDAQIASVLAAISSMPKPVFVHCQYGCDRTGMVIACYRIQYDHWANSKALREAEVHGFSRFEVEMRDYILHFNTRQ
jgi:protein tyrosine/serine phosphatase